MSLRTAFRSIVVVILFALPAMADEAKTATYDVRSLIVAVTDFKVGEAPATQPSMDAQVSALIAAVRDVLPTGAAIRELGGQLIVTADAAGQEAVQRLIAQTTADRGRQLMIESRVIRVGDTLIRSLPPALQTAIAAAAFDHGRQPAELDAKTAGDLLAAVRGDSGVAQLTAPRLTTFDNQQAFVAVQTDTGYIKALNKTTAPDGKASYEPVIDTLATGVTMTAKGRTTADGSATALQYHLELTRLLAIDEVQQAGGNVQVPRVASDTFDGLYVVPSGKTLLVMPTAQAGNNDATSRTFVLVKATGIVPHDAP